MELKDLMEAFARAFGISDLQPDGDGVYNVKIDEMAVSFVEAAEARKLVTWAEVGGLPAAGRERLYRVLLESMYMGRATGGATFSIEKGSDKLVFHRLDPLEGMDFESFATTLDGFVNLLERWRGILAEYESSTADLTDGNGAANPPPAAPQFGREGFMQV